MVLGVADAETGWLARYYASDDWSGRPEWSSDFRLANATRIDRSLSFSGTEFPTHYLNGPNFVSGVRREFSEPMSVEWSGAFDAPAAMVVAFDMRANGSASIAFDDSPPYQLSAAGTGRHQVSAGRHGMVVKYSKPADADGDFHLSLRDAAGEPVAVVPPDSPLRSTAMISLATGLDVLVIALLLAVTCLSLA